MSKFEYDTVFDKKTYFWRKEGEEYTIVQCNGEHILNPTASYIWELIDDDRTVSDIINEFKAKYSGMAEEKVLEDAVLEALKEFLEKGLITVSEKLFDL